MSPKKGGQHERRNCHWCIQITQLSKVQDFSTKLNSTKRRAWKAFENVYRNFPGNAKVENYSEIVQELISPLSAIECNTSWYFIFWLSIRIFFLKKMGAVSNEHGEKFHHDISQYGKGYSGKWSPNMLDDYCWNFIRETPTGKSKRQKKMKWVLN
jgi:hypothetical protein